MKRTHGSNPSVGGAGIQMATGTYVGNAAATQAIAGVGFQPKFVIIRRLQTASHNTDVGYKTDQDGLYTQYTSSAIGGRYELDHIISLDADGFTVGDGTGNPYGNTFNINLENYAYVAFR